MKFYRGLTIFFTFLLFFANFSVSQAQVNHNIFTVPAGTIINLKMDNEINSKVASVNDTFTATISRPVVIREFEVLSIGSIVEGRIIAVKPAAAVSKDGAFELKFETLLIKNEVKRTIDASLVFEKTAKKSSIFQTISILGGTAVGAVMGGLFGKGKGALLGGMMGAGIGTGIPWLKKGKEARIKTNQEFVIRLNQEVMLPVTDF